MTTFHVAVTTTTTNGKSMYYVVEDGGNPEDDSDVVFGTSIYSALADLSGKIIGRRSLG